VLLSPSLQGGRVEPVSDFMGMGTRLLGNWVGGRVDGCDLVLTPHPSPTP
jgi:hypothetical protein